MTHGALAKVLIAVAMILTALQLPRLAFGDSVLYTDVLGPTLLMRLSACIKIAFLAVAAEQARRCARVFEPGNPARRAWQLLAIGLFGYVIGQCILGYYQVVLGVSAPYPSAADAFFLSGMTLIAVALFVFVRAHVDAGMVPIHVSRLMLASVGLFLVLTAGTYPLLWPVVTSDAPAAERALNGAYPVLDLLVATAAVVLLRNTLQMRGGRVWQVWAFLLGGFLFMVFGDILFGYFSSLERLWLEPVLDLLYALAYLFVALGTLLQADLVSRPLAPVAVAAS